MFVNIQCHGIIWLFCILKIIYNNLILKCITDKNIIGLRIKDMKNNAKKANKKLVTTLIILSVVLLSALAGIYLFTYLQNQKHLSAIDKDTFYDGIYVDNVHLGGLTMQEATEAVNSQHATDESEIYVTIRWDENEEYTYTSQDIEISYNTGEVLDEAYQLGRTGSNPERYNEVSNLQQTPVYFETARTFDPSALEGEIKQIASSKSTSASEPAVQFNPDTSLEKEDWFIYDNAASGIETDPDALWESVCAALANEDYGVIDIPRWEIHPDENTDLREITTLIVSFKTVQSSNANRMHNIALACSMINGTVLLPGEEFSMNNTTGKRTTAAGFLEANTIVGGNELVPDVAGGVCQVSGTLFNAALMADMEITERFHHSFELSYLTRGRDATVNYGTADLKFVNTHDYPVYIAMYTEGQNVYAEIYGAPLENCDHITIWVKTLKTVPIGDPVYVKDDTVPAGSEPVLLNGHQGITCEVYRIYRDENGEQIASELSHTDVYKYYAPELHVNPADYEGYINPTAEPTNTPEVSDSAEPEATTPAPSEAPTAEPTKSSVG